MLYFSNSLEARYGYVTKFWNMRYKQKRSMKASRKLPETAANVEGLPRRSSS